REVGRAPGDRGRVVLEQRGVQRLAGPDLAHATVQLHRADGGDDDRRVRGEAGGAALDVEELLCAHLRAEAGLGDDEGGSGQRVRVGDDGVGAGGDVAEWSTVDERGAALEGLHEVWLDRVPEEHGHGAGDLEVLGGDGAAVAAGGQHDPAEPGPHVGE